MKDYYFREDHTGISRIYIRQTIAIGDIITHVEDQPILSLSFPDILEKLRNIAGRTRVVKFKNLSSAIQGTPLYGYYLLT